MARGHSYSWTNSLKRWHIQKALIGLSWSGLLLSLYLKFELIYWLPVLDRFRNWLYSGEANIFNEFSDTLELVSV